MSEKDWDDEPHVGASVICMVESKIGTNCKYTIELRKSETMDVNHTVSKMYFNSIIFL